MPTSMLSEADRFLLEAIRRGDAEGWSQLVARYRGRLFAFARARVRNEADAEDLVQETFVSFLGGLVKFRGEASLETFLFTILRRRVIDAVRGRKANICRLGGEGEPLDAAELASREPTASWYARREEGRGVVVESLAAALGGLVEGFKEKLNFEDLRVAEALFYAQLRNQEAASAAGVSEGQVGLKKHRWIKEVREGVGAAVGGEELWESPELLSGLIAAAWESRRLSCPKRSTLGRYLLGTLEEDWREYVRFHVEELGCGFCVANLADLRAESDKPAPSPLHDRILQSTVGFFRR